MGKFDNPKRPEPSLEGEQKVYIALINSPGWAKMVEYLTNREDEIIRSMDDPKTRKWQVIGQLQEVRALKTLPEQLANAAILVPDKEELEKEIVRSTLGIPDPTNGIL